MRTQTQTTDKTPDKPAYRILRPRELPLDQIHSSDLPRDRLNLKGQEGSEEMEELKASLRLRGQRTPVTVCRDAQDCYQLVSGWRRLTALQQLAQEQGEAAPMITARLTGLKEARIELYIDMVESNLLHKALSFGEMAQLALTAAADPELQELGVEEVVSRLYGSLHKMKRSYIRSFIHLLQVLGDTVQYPERISRNQGVAVSRRLKNAPETAEDLRDNLRVCDSGSMQGAVFAQYLLSFREASAKSTAKERQFKVGNTHITGRVGECVIRADVDFSSLRTEVLSRALRAFERIVQAG
ncbi:chromosome partitioning protein ParB [Sedimentitalea sp. CY04]|uniref:Chromosome partitioning protein ParB n=1 Tax=Parasedimentitalea denitrificans TaxID=2211118 RepID=A0ABX0WCJ8_9RHOB|nr:ParB N-terminal domain-containing protein [Sedimentitalea sp. CY04]NIZ62578.1 chromosome partitioning protein ParB [Sedimentitalea sp. CY04]